MEESGIKKEDLEDRDLEKGVRRGFRGRYVDGRTERGVNRAA